MLINVTQVDFQVAFTDVDVLTFWCSSHLTKTKQLGGWVFLHRGSGQVPELMDSTAIVNSSSLRLSRKKEDHARVLSGATNLRRVEAFPKNELSGWWCGQFRHMKRR